MNTVLCVTCLSSTLLSNFEIFVLFVLFSRKCDDALWRGVEYHLPALVFRRDDCSIWPSNSWFIWVRVGVNSRLKRLSGVQMVVGHTYKFPKNYKSKPTLFCKTITSVVCSCCKNQPPLISPLLLSNQVRRAQGGRKAFQVHGKEEEEECCQGPQMASQQAPRSRVVRARRRGENGGFGDPSVVRPGFYCCEAGVGVCVSIGRRGLLNNKGTTKRGSFFFFILALWIWYRSSGRYSSPTRLHCQIV